MTTFAIISPTNKPSNRLVTASNSRHKMKKNSVGILAIDGWAVNPLDPKGNYTCSATSNNMKLVHWTVTLCTARRVWAGYGPA